MHYFKKIIFLTVCICTGNHKAAFVFIYSLGGERYYVPKFTFQFAGKVDPTTAVHLFTAEHSWALTATTQIYHIACENV